MSAGSPRRLADAVAWFAVEPARTGLFSDFDGTLAPIVARPDSAAALPGAIEALSHLATRLAVVGVVSGRPLEFLVNKLDLQAGRRGATSPDGEARSGLQAYGLQAYGLHGIEHMGPGGETAVEPAVLAWRGAIEAARDAALRAAPAGVEVEDKLYGVTVHWRNAPDPAMVEPSATALAADLAFANGLVARRGKASVELVPPVGIDKGTVVTRWGEREGIDRVGFLGDDVSDALAFAALDRLAGEGSAAVLKVAVTGPDAPPTLLEGADVVLDSPAEAVRLLSELSEMLDRSKR